MINYVKKYKSKNWYNSKDVMAAPLMLAYGIGRIGCHMSGDGDWGVQNLNQKPVWIESFLPDWIWGYTYPNNVIRAGGANEICSDPLGIYCYELANPVYPTAVYEVLNGDYSIYCHGGLEITLKLQGCYSGCIWYLTDLNVSLSKRLNKQ